MATPRLLIEIAASLGTFQADFGRASAIAEQNSRRISRSIDDAKRSAIEFGKGLASAIGIPLSIGAALAVFDSLKDKALESERAVAQLNAVLRATGSAAGLSRSDLTNLAGGVRDNSIFSTTEIQEAETALLRFRVIQGDAFREGLKLAPDLATAMGTTLPHAAASLARAVIDPARGLRQLKQEGVNLSEQFIDTTARLRESGDIAGVAAVIYSEVGRSIGGSAKANAEGLSGSVGKLTRAWKELGEEVGRNIFGGDQSPARVLTDILEGLRKKLDEINKERERFEKFGTVPSQETLFGTALRSGAGLLGVNVKPPEPAQQGRESRFSAALRAGASAFGVTIRPPQPSATEAIPQAEFASAIAKIPRATAPLVNIEGVLPLGDIEKIAEDIARSRNISLQAAKELLQPSGRSKDDLEVFAQDISKTQGISIEQARAFVGQREQVLLQANEREYSETQAQGKRNQASAAAFFGAQLQTQKLFLDRESSEYTFAYSQNAISADQFYSGQRQLAQKAYADQIASIEGRKRAEEAFRALPSTDRPQRIESESRTTQLNIEASQAGIVLGNRLGEITQRQFVDVKQLREEYERLEVTLKELSGDTVGAAAQGFDLQARRDRQRFTAESGSNDPAVAASARAGLSIQDATRQRIVQQAALNKIEQDYGVILDAVSNAQARIDLQQQTGAITELDALNQKASAAKALIPELQKVAQMYEDIARTSGDPRFLIAADTLKLKIEQLGAAADAVAKKFNDVFVSSISDAITQFAVGGTKLSDIFKNLEKSIVGGISRIASQNIGETLFGKDGPLGGVGKFLGGLFGKKDQGVGTPPLFPPEAVEAATKQASAALATATSATELGASATILTTAGTSLTTAAAALQAAAGALSASSGASAIGGGFSGFGGGGGGFTPDPSTSFTPEAFDLFGGFANGTDYAAGGWKMVGERGPEMMHVPRGAQVVPNEYLQAKRFQKQGGGGQTNHVTVNVTVAGSTNSATAGQVGAQAAKEVRRALARYA